MKTLSLTFILSTLLILSVNRSSFAQAGANDPTFNPTDLGFGNGDGVDGKVNATAIQSDGKILIGGIFFNYNGTSRNCIARLNIDGSLDTSFDPGTGLTDAKKTYDNVEAIAIQSDGKILVGGNFSKINGIVRYKIVRLNSDGSVDNSLDPDTVVGTDRWDHVKTIKILSDGKILIGGIISNENVKNLIAKLNSDGSLDTTFNSEINSAYELTSIVPLSDGWILIGGDLINNYTNVRTPIVRLNSDGSLDQTFQLSPEVVGNSTSMDLESGGKILVGLNYTSYGLESRVVRLNIDGSMDKSFDSNKGLMGSIINITSRPNGKILICGEFQSYNGSIRRGIARLHNDGSIDNEFNQNTGAYSIYVMVFQNDDKILVQGSITTDDGARRGFTRLNEDGSLDTDFNRCT